MRGYVIGVIGVLVLVYLVDTVITGGRHQG